MRCALLGGSGEADGGFFRVLESVGDLLVALGHRGDGRLNSKLVEDAKEDQEADYLHDHEFRLETELLNDAGFLGGFSDSEESSQHDEKGTGGRSVGRRGASEEG